jgi:MFS family permease
LNQPTTAPGKGRALVGLLIVGLGTMVVPLDTALNIAFPDITADFAIPIADIQWIIIFYILTYTSLMLVCGKLGDLYGYKRIFQVGLAVSALAFVLCAMAPAYHWLLAARILQGLGGALILSCGPALATALFPESQRGRALGAYTMMFGIGAAVGPSLGGIMVQNWGWEAVFWFRLPLSLLALAALPWLRPAQGERRTGGFDLLGAFLLAVGLGALMLALNQMQVDAMRGAAVATLGVLALTAFVRRELRAREPIVPLAVFRRLDFTMLNVVNALVNLVGFSSYLLVPYFLVRATDYSLALGGVLLATSAIGQAAVAPLCGWLLSWRPWASRLALLGGAMVAGGTMLIGTWGLGAGLWIICVPLALQGMGMGLFQVCILDVATGRLDAKDRGVAGSLAMVSRTIGNVLSATSLSLVFAGLRQMHAEAGMEPGAAFLSAFQSTFFYAGTGLLICLAITLARPRLWFN